MSVATFSDCLGREWVLRLTLGDIPRVKDATAKDGRPGIDLNAVLTDATALGRLVYSDPDTLGRVLWVLVEKQADRLGVTPEGFADGFDGETLARCGDALAEAVTDFFLPRQAATVKAGLPATLAAIDQAVAAAVTEQMAPRPRPSRPSGGGSPASSALTPGPFPSVNWP